MADVPSNLTAAIYAKTAQGQQEIPSRSLGLTPLARRILVLVDGKRSGQDLSTFAPGGEISAQLTELLSRDCIEAVGVAQPAALPQLRATSLSDIRKKPGRTEYQRGILAPGADGQPEVRITGSQGSGILRSMSEANCMVVLHDEQGNIAAGDMVDVLLFEGLM